LLKLLLKAKYQNISKIAFIVLAFGYNLFNVGKKFLILSLSLGFVEYVSSTPCLYINNVGIN